MTTTICLYDNYFMHFPQTKMKIVKKKPCHNLKREYFNKELNNNKLYN